MFSHLSVLQSSPDLTCLTSFEKVDIYATKNYRQKYRAPTDFCFILKVEPGEIFSLCYYSAQVVSEREWC